MGLDSVLEGADQLVYVLWVVPIGLVTWIVVKLFPVVRKFVAFINDVAGEEARPGRPARPGLFERLGNIENTQQEMVKKVNVVHHEMFPNSGKSMRDQNNRIEAKVSADYNEISNLKLAVKDLKEGQDSQKQALDEHITLSAGILKALKSKE